MPERPTNQSDPESIAHTLHCINCGYLLVGLPREGVCPECGLPIAASLERGLAARLGPRESKRLSRATGWLEASASLFALGLCMPPLTHAVPVVWAVGAWMLGRVDPHDAIGGETGARALSLRRSGITLGLVALGSGAVLFATTQLQPRGGAPGLGWSGPQIVRLVLIVAAFGIEGAVFGWSVRAGAGRLAGFAQLLPDAVVVRRLRRVRALAPVWAGGLVAYFALIYGSLLHEGIGVSGTGMLTGGLVVLVVVGWVASLLALNALTLWRITLGGKL